MSSAEVLPPRCNSFPSIQCPSGTELIEFPQLRVCNKLPCTPNECCASTSLCFAVCFRQTHQTKRERERERERYSDTKEYTMGSKNNEKLVCGVLPYSVFLLFIFSPITTAPCEALTSCTMCTEQREEAQQMSTNAIVMAAASAASSSCVWCLQTNRCLKKLNLLDCHGIRIADERAKTCTNVTITNGLHTHKHTHIT